MSLLARAHKQTNDYFSTMIRKQLAKENGQRKRFRATFSRFGKKVNYNGYTETTILLVRVTDMMTNVLVTDHLWFSYTKGFEKLRLQEGMVIEFDARVKEYTKGYVNKQYKMNDRRKDYKLSHPTKISVAGQPPLSSEKILP